MIEEGFLSLPEQGQGTAGQAGDTRFEITIRGAAFYTDEYVKQGGRWLIRSTGYKRTFEEMQSRKDVPGLKLTASWWGTGGQSDISV